MTSLILPALLTLTEALTQAGVSAPEIQISREGVAAAEARVSSATGRMLPKLTAAGGVQYWDKEILLTLDIPGFELPPGSSPVIREQLTASATLTLSQPLTPLYALGKARAAEQAGVAVQRHEVARAELDTASRVVEAYLTALKARALAEVAETAVASVDAHLKQAQALEAGGVLSKVDLLRLEAARDGARQGLLRARAGAEIAARSIVLATGAAADEPPALSDELPAEPPAPAWDRKAMLALATARRPETARASAQARAARAGASAATAQLIPTVAAVAQLQHNEGSGSLSPKDAWFVGAQVTWDVWDWGTVWGASKEAKAHARAAEIGVRAQKDVVAFDVDRRLLEARAAHESLAVAKSGLTAAEEASRIQAVRFEQGAATTTDVLDADVALTQARSSFATARFDYYLAVAGVARAVGVVPGPAWLQTGKEGL